MIMTPLPVCTVINNPPEDLFEDDITEEASQIVHNIQTVVSSSDSEDDQALNNGYELLPQQESDCEIEEANATSIDESAVESENEHNSACNYSAAQILALCPSDANRATQADELKEVWRSETTVNNQPMDPELAEKIKAAMADFSLPTSAVPAWATLVPEEEWKAQLVASIKSRTTGCQRNTDNSGGLTTWKTCFSKH